MGREVKRVPLDFEWPRKKVWKGFLMDESLHAIPCTACDQSGYNPETRQLSIDWYDNVGFGKTWTYEYGTGRDGQPADRPPWKVLGTTRRWMHDITQDEVQALVDAGRLMDFTHTWTKGPGWQKKPGNPVPTAAEVNEWSHHGFGHDAINQYICVEARAKRLGVYGKCAHCGGEGRTFRDEAHRAAHEAWESSEPPEGTGWQMWETTSEGSPISPVMPTPEKLARWLADTGASSFGGEGASYTQWLGMIKAGWAPSMIATSNGGIESGVVAVIDDKEPLITVSQAQRRSNRIFDMLEPVDVYHFEALLPAPNEELEEWLNERDILFESEQTKRGGVVLTGKLYGSTAMEFKLRWT